jgi:hypothetical protein
VPPQRINAPALDAPPTSRAQPEAVVAPAANPASDSVEATPPATDITTSVGRP